MMMTFVSLKLKRDDSKVYSIRISLQSNTLTQDHSKSSDMLFLEKQSCHGPLNNLSAT